MNKPFVTIILPVRNESAFIDQVLLALLDQDYPVDNMEVLVVNGNSKDDTRRTVLDFASLHPQLRIQIFDNPQKIVPISLNMALREARGEVIIRVDGHCIIAPDYVCKCVEHLQKDGVDGVGGPMKSFGKTRMANAISIGMSSPFGVGNSAFRTTSGRTMLVDTVPFPAYTRQIIRNAGHYDEELVRNQDDEYNYRIRELGGKILLAADVRSTYFSRTSLKGLWRQYLQYGYWKVRVMQKHPFQMSLRQFIPPVFVLALLFSVLLFLLTFAGLTSSIPRPLPLIIPSFYLIANLGTSLLTAWRRGWDSLLFLPLIFGILHLSYGFGFLAGLVKFRDRWGDKSGQLPAWSYETAE